MPGWLVERASRGLGRSHLGLEPKASSPEDLCSPSGCCFRLTDKLGATQTGPRADVSLLAQLDAKVIRSPGLQTSGP